MPLEPTGPLVAVRLPIPVRRRVADALAFELSIVAEDADANDSARPTADAQLHAVVDAAERVAARAFRTRCAALAALGGPVDVTFADALERTCRRERDEEAGIVAEGGGRVPADLVTAQALVVSFDRALDAIAEARR